MKHENPLLRGTESLSEEQKLQLFAIEELETRLEMATNIGGSSIITGTGMLRAGDDNNVCWTK